MTNSVVKTNKDNEGRELPKHIALIPDGNRRWAKMHNLPQLEGHRRGFDTANKDIKRSRELGIHTMTLWAFSTENWNRSKVEVDYLMKLYETNIEKNLNEAMKTNTRIIHLGRKDRIPTSLKEKIIDAESKTELNTEHILNIALDYGGHDEIIRAVSRFAQDVLDNKHLPEDIEKEVGKYKDKYPYYLFGGYLDTKDQPFPYPDLVIRTSGEQRLSGFLSWQMAYAELYFTKLFMPDFGPDQLEGAVDEYMGRERRFGGNSVDVKG
ncbi:MAG: polyprenyl diphosphate synthase [Patescibacteria group bacterium]|jgi:undecaprenyl diphosphate synthase